MYIIIHFIIHSTCIIHYIMHNIYNIIHNTCIIQYIYMYIYMYIYIYNIYIYIYMYIYIYISCFIYIYIYNLHNIWGVKLAKTRYLPTSFTRRLLQGRRIYRFISICELCLQLENLTSYKWRF